MSVRAQPLAFRLLVVASLLGMLAACKPASQPQETAVPADATTDAPSGAPAGTDTSTAQASSPLADAAAALNPLASPKDKVVTAIGKFMAVDSYHASMHIAGGPQGEMTNEIDFVAPDRFRMTLAGVGTQTIIGDTMYMNMEGRSMKMPLPKGTIGQWRDPAKLTENAATMTVQAQGSDSIDGMSTDKYLVHNTQPQPSDVTMWIGAQGLPVQMQVDSTAQGQATQTTIRYSRFNDPALRIEPPQ